jgi:hypothetical protein
MTKLTWKSYTADIPENVGNYHGAHQDFNLFLGIVRDLAGDVAGGELQHSAFTIFNACAKRAADAKYVIPYTDAKYVISYTFD